MCIRDSYRFEIKNTKTARLHELRIKTLADLTDLVKLELLKQDYLNKWDQVFLLDWTILESKLTPKQRNKLKDWKRANYWVELSKNQPRNQFYRELESYSKIVQGHSDSVKTIIKEAIIQKWCKVTTEAIQDKESVLVQGHSIIIGDPALITRRCIITGIDISIQKLGSKFLRESILSQIYKNDKFLYQELRTKFGPRHDRLLSQENEIQAICKNIRNQDSNPRTLFRYRILRYQYSLFPL